MMDSKYLNILRSNSRTFYLASKLLPHDVRKDVIKIYAFCRTYDDNVDLRLSSNTSELENNIRQLGIDIEIINQLKDGIDSDKNFDKISTLDDLIVYSYKVAGCVGIMMCDVLNVSSDQAKYHAIDLGIAMQITNICRDIMDDYAINRKYLPDSMITKSELDSGDLDKIFSVSSNLIEISEQYYRSAEEGIKYIPLSSRFSILYALKLYQAIGRKILKNKTNFLSRRINTSKLEKVIIFFKTTYQFIFKYIRFDIKGHQSTLHNPLYGLPKVNEKI